MKFSLKNGRMPILTTKKMAWKRVCENCSGLFTEAPIIRSQRPERSYMGFELTREFLDKRGYPNTTTEILDMYGFQWRHYGAKYWVQIQLRKRRDRPTAKHNRFVKEQKHGRRGGYLWLRGTRMSWIIWRYTRATYCVSSTFRTETN
jgi:hypothetical protein